MNTSTRRQDIGMKSKNQIGDNKRPAITCDICNTIICTGNADAPFNKVYQAFEIAMLVHLRAFHAGVPESDVAFSYGLID